MNSAFSDNHALLTQDQTILGMHNALTLRPQAADPATTVDQTAIYNKLDANTVPELFFRPNNSQTPIQMTFPSIKADSTATQYSFVAGPFIIYGGLITNPTLNQVVTLTPGTTLIYVDLIMTGITLPGFFVPMAVPTNITGTSFTISFENIAHPPFNLYYFAVGQ